MPEFSYQNPKTEEIITLIQSCHDIHEYTDKNGLKWLRIWDIPQMGIDTKIDPYSAADFARATNKKDSYGTLLDRAKESAAQRVEKEGVDPISDKYYKDWAAKRKGKMVHPDKKKQHIQEKIKNTGFEIN